MKRHYCNIIASIRRTIDSNYVLKTRALRQIPALVTWATEEYLLFQLAPDWCGFDAVTIFGL